MFLRLIVTSVKFVQQIEPEVQEVRERKESSSQELSEACEDDELSCSSCLLSRKAVNFAQQIESEGRAVRVRESGGGCQM